MRDLPCSKAERLEADQVRSYDENGFLLLEGLISHAEVEDLRSEVQRLLVLAAGRDAHDDLFDFEDAGQTGRERLGSGVRSRERGWGWVGRCGRGGRSAGVSEGELRRAEGEEDSPAVVVRARHWASYRSVAQPRQRA